MLLVRDLKVIFCNFYSLLSVQYYFLQQCNVSWKADSII